MCPIRSAYHQHNDPSDTPSNGHYAGSMHGPLLFGNFVVGTRVLAPADLINEISIAFAVDVPMADQ